MSTQTRWIERAQKVLPAGGFGNFEAGIVIRDGEGSRVRDEDGKEYVDYLIGSGPMILGHGNREVLEVVQQQAGKGLTFFANNARGIELAEEICSSVACAEQVRYVSTGSEADMYAIRLARAFTGRDRILKFEGGYHGMSAESLMSLAPTVLQDLPAAIPDSAGIPDSVRDHMIIAPFNDHEFVKRVFAEHGRDIAAVIVEPLQRLIPPQPDFLELLRRETKANDALLIFDEVVTGYRFAYGGAQEKYGVVPDICTLGKIIGGGFPLAAIAGREDIMAHFDKSRAGSDGFLYQVGTLSGNPVASAAGLKTMEILRRPGAYETLRASGERIMKAITRSFDRHGIAHQIVGDPTLFDVVFTADPVLDYRDTLKSTPAQMAAYNDTLREHGILKPPSKWYMSLALTEHDLAQTETALDAAAQRIAEA